MVKIVPLGSLIFRLFEDSLVVTRSVEGTYKMGGEMLSCPFLHSEPFKPLELFEDGIHFWCAARVSYLAQVS
jgi:hypothetical protein